MKKILTLSITLILVAGIVSMAKSTPIDSDNIGDAQGTSRPKDRHIVKTSAGTIVVLYQRGFTPSGIRAKKSTDNGATWTQLDGTLTGSTRISSRGNFSICLDGDDNIYVAYNVSDDIYFKKLTYSVSGGTWTVPASQTTVESTGVDVFAYNPSITRQSDGTLWVSYGYDDGVPGARVRTRYSTDTVNWGNIEDVSSGKPTALADEYWSALVIRDTVPFIVYADMDTNSFKWSYWTGSSWDSTGTVTTDSPSFGFYTDGDFSVTTTGNDVHLVYNQRLAGIKHRYYDGSWSVSATELSSDSDDKNVSLTTNDSDLWVFISSHVATDQYNIMYKMRSGGTWDSTWTAVIEDNANNLYSTTPLSTTEYIPLAWTEGTSPYTVEFDSSVVVVVATTYTWTDGAANGVWADASNWSGGTGWPDDKNDKAVINTSTRTINTPGGTLTLGQLELSGSYTGTLALGGALTLDSSGPWNGSLTISAGTTLDLAGNSLSGASSFTNNGTLKLQGGETTNIPPARGTGSTVEYTATFSSRPIKNWDYYHLKINGSGGTFTVGAGETLLGNLTIAAGIFDLNGYTVNVSSSFLKSGGTLYMHSINDELDIEGNFTVEGGAVDITVSGAKIYVKGNIDISGDNSFNPSGGSYYMDGAGTATVSITGANNDFGYGSEAYFRVAKTNSTDTVTLLTDMAGRHFVQDEGIFDVNEHNVLFDGVYYGYSGSKLQMSSGTFRCGRNGYNGGSRSPWYCQSGWTENISGGTITVYGGKHATYGTAHFANGSNFTPTGGTFELVGITDSSIYIAEEHDAHFNFYNLTIGDGTNTKTVEMHASSYPLDVDANFTVKTNATFNTGGKAVDVAGSVDIDGTFNASSSTITVAGNWDSSAGTFTYGTSTVDLTGTGNLKTSTTGGARALRFHNLKVAAAGEETTLLSHIGVADILTLGDATGTLTDGLGSYNVTLGKNSGTPLSHGGATIALNRIIYHPSDGTVTVTGGNYGTLDLLLFPSDSGATFNLGGSSVTVAGVFWLLAANGKSGVICDTNDYDITATGLYFGGGSSNDGSTTLNCKTSTINIGTSGVDMTNNGGSHILNLSSATVTCAGNWQLSDGSGSIAQIPGTSTVTLNGLGAQTVTSAGESFYHLEINNTAPGGAGVELQDAADIDGGLIVTTGGLVLNSYDITISSDVSISGSGLLTCSSVEQITVGGNWTAASGAGFTAASSTTTFNGNGSFNILSSGTTFYNLLFNNNVSTWTLTDALYVENDFTQLNGAFDTNSSGNYPVTIGDDITISGGRFYARASIITLTGSNSDGSADWDSYTGTFTYGTSTVVLTSTGTVRGSDAQTYNRPFYNLTCAYPEKTTTLLTTIAVRGILSVQGGIFTGSFRIYLRKTPSTPISIVGGSTISVGSLRFGGTQNVPAYDYDSILTVWTTGTITQLGDITCTGLLVDGDNFASRSPTWNTDSHSLTINGGLKVGGTNTTYGSGGTHTFNANGSTITISGSVTLNHPVAANAILNLNTSNMRVAGNWTITNGTVNPGTSSVTFYGTGPSILTGSTTFYVLISTTSTKTVEFTSDTETGVTGHLNFENITLQSTSGGATWYLNLSGTQDVSDVDVKDSNASGSTDTIIAFTSTDSGNNTKWDFGPPEAITDLTGECDGDTGDVTLYWSTPGDDYNWQNTLVDDSKYRIDYSSYSIAWSTENYKVDIPTHSVAPHTQVSHTITGLTADTTWYFRIWTADEIPLWSGLSNGATVWVSVIVSSVTVSAYTDGTPDVPPTYVYTQSTGNCLGTFRFEGTGTISSMTITEYGTCDADGDLENVELFEDDGDGDWELGEDTNQLGSTNFNSSNKATFSEFSLVASTYCYVHVILDVKSVPDSGGTVGIELYQDDIVCTSTTTASSWPVQLETSMIIGEDTSPSFDNFRSQNSTDVWITTSEWNDDSTPNTKVRIQDTGSGLRIGSQEVSPDTHTVLLMHLNNDTTDYSGQGNHGTREGGVGWTNTDTWKTGVDTEDILDFDGNDDYINCGNSSTLNTPHATISAWIRLDPTATTRNIVARDTSYDGWRDFQFRATTNDKLQFIVFVGNTNYNATSTASIPEDGTWTHVLGTYDGATVQCYINGIPDGTNTDPSGNMDNDGGYLSIGARINDSTPIITATEHFKGLIDEVRILDRALTADEVAADYYSGLFKYSKDGGSTWYSISGSTVAWSTGTVTGVNGSTSYETIHASNVPFNQYSGTENKIKFLVSDTNGNIAYSSEYIVMIGSITVSAYTDGDPDVPPTYVYTQSTGNCLGTFKFDGVGTITELTITEYGNCDADGELENVELYEDDGNGNWESGQDTTQLGSTTNFSASEATFSGFSLVASTDTSCYVHVVLDVKSNADDGDTVGIELYQDDIVCTSTTTATSWPVQLGTSTIKDATAPAAITDLTGLCDSGSGNVKLSWSTPGDDGWIGTLVSGSKYRIDYSSYSIAWSTNTYDVDISTSGVAPHTQVSHTITGLTSNTTYYFQIWTADEVSNWSGLSNGATVWTYRIAVWDGEGVGNNWSTAANWTGDIVPRVIDDVVFNDTSNKPCTIDISTTVASFSIQTGSTITITASGNLTVTGDISLSTGTFNAGSTLLTIGGSWSVTAGDALFNCETSTVTFNSNDTGKTITSGGSSLASVVFDSGDDTGGWTLQDALTCSSLQVVDGTLTDNTQTVTVNGDIDIANTPGVLVSSGTWIQGANGNISNKYWHNNKFNILQIDNNVTSTRTERVITRKLILGTDATLQGSNNISLIFPTVNDFIDMGTDSSIIEGIIEIVPSDGSTLTQKAINPSVSVGIVLASTATIQMTGNWTTGELVIFGAPASGTEGEAMVLDTNGYNLTVNGNLKLGYQEGLCYGKILFSSGTHSITGNVDVYSGVLTHGYFYLGSADISIGEDCDFRKATVTPGTSTVTFNAGSAGWSITSASQSFYNVVFNNASGGWTLEDDLDVDGDLTISAGTLDTKSGGNNPINIAGNWTFEGGTFECRQSTVTFDNASSTSTLTGSTTFYGLVSTASGKNVKFTSYIVIGVTNHLNFENITLQSTSPGATWYLNLSGTQDVSNVIVRDSNASGSTDTIIAFTSTDSGNNTKWDFGPPEAITDLTGECDGDTGDVTLYWSTPGDDYNWQNTLVDDSKYRIDYSSYSIAWSTENYKVDIPTHSVAPHTQVSYTITGLTGGTTYYFQIWTADEIPLWSGLSNGATVWVNPVLSVTIEPSVRPFGEVPANQSDVLSDEFTVENTGNITQKYQLRLTGVPTGWTAKNVAGAPEWEQVKILGLFTTQSPPNTTHFNDNPPNAGDGDIVRTTNGDEATSTNFAISGEGVEVKGYNVTVGAIRYLWFRFDAPSGTTITTEQFLTVTVTAIQQ